eukprot:CAMPEP_0196588000 /NCGR_PEP_ID=MMETSP1081-20130531/59253_1 /TAXON_ID=36882 /ORGANISM="Pyramimonas amylifera, Strain CCMP720" /LENGTH=285 /DNA_ID=CAMNT_0041910357 /DNA_START=444 /DNA_END=1298 /DNA_ORIENTATION=-
MMLNFCDEGEVKWSFDTAVKDDGDMLEYNLGGVKFQIAQDPGNLVVGASIWRSGQILAQRIITGTENTSEDETAGMLPVEFRAAGLAGRSGLELGAGCAGLVGLALAMRGCTRVVLTDQAEVLPMLRENVRRFLIAAAAAPDGTMPAGCAALTGAIVVRELDWLNAYQVAEAAAAEGFDRVVCADGTYAESLHLAFLASTSATSASDAAILFMSDMRSSREHFAFRNCFGGEDALGRFIVKVLIQNLQNSRFPNLNKMGETGERIDDRLSLSAGWSDQKLMLLHW